MPNRLAQEQSPYLLQHANNPVDWYPWGDEPFERAKAAHKPVIVSIGYAACHWCHVMEHESFENDEVAAFMNEHFVCIKVDREEHPDVDHIYMDAVQAISGSGGWPLNVFVTPDRQPFYGGTYYPPRPAYSRPSWMQLLRRMSQVWAQQQDEVMLQAGQMIEHLRQSSQRMFSKERAEWSRETCDRIAADLLNHADKEKGGFGAAPKFPGTMAITYLLEHHYFSGNEASLQHALRSLDAMADGGIYDQLGGGFARYSTDREWLAPHFEKMLYDNALLVCAYCDAYAVTKNPRYKTIVEEVIAFAERELRDSSGGYYCALDADSEGVEGKFYTWTWDEWTNALGGEEPLAAAYFGVAEHGNWEETNILHITRSIEDVAAMHGVTVDEAIVRMAQVKQKLLQVSNTRIRPLTDDKSLLSWNALMNVALSKAAATLGNEQYRQRAVAHMHWMLNTYTTADGLMHCSKGGVARIPAKLDDYAYLAQALLQLASVAGDNTWIRRGEQYMNEVMSGFLHDEGFFYYTSVTQHDIPVRKVDIYDGATPSANAVMAHNLLLYGLCLEKGNWLELSDTMLNKITGYATNHSYSFAYWAQLIQRSIAGVKTAVITGSDALAAWRELSGRLLPHVYTLMQAPGGASLPVTEGKEGAAGTAIYVCTEHECLPPVAGIGALLSAITPHK